MYINMFKIGWLCINLGWPQPVTSPIYPQKLLFILIPHKST